jgi:hypothetical protein
MAKMSGNLLFLHEGTQQTRKQAHNDDEETNNRKKGRVEKERSSGS